MRFPLKCAFAACALLAFALFALGSDSQRAAAGEHYRGHGGGGGGGGWSGGVGVGTILLNEAIRRQQEKQQYKQHVTQPKGCPEGMTWSTQEADLRQRQGTRDRQMRAAQDQDAEGLRLPATGDRLLHV